MNSPLQETTREDPQNINNPTPQSPDQTKPISNYFYPISDYNNRIKVKTFGQYFSAASSPPICGRVFIGYHVGDDLEAKSEELSSDLPVFAVADGTVRQISFVNGYGGLLIMDTKLGDTDVTVYYGHISLTSAKVKVGDVVEGGQELAFLGEGCSNQTDGERKHLHFAIHKGNSIDVRGYVQTLSELNNWLNPKEALINLNANHVP